MTPDHLGAYCLVDDVALDLDQAKALRDFNRRLKRLGHGSVHELVVKLEAEQEAFDKTRARIEPMKQHLQFFKVADGESERGFKVVRVRDDHAQLLIDEHMEIWVAFINQRPSDRTMVFLDADLHIKRIMHV
jgi:hypothetical protein